MPINKLFNDHEKEGAGLSNLYPEGSTIKKVYIILIIYERWIGFFTCVCEVRLVWQKRKFVKEKLWRTNVDPALDGHQPLTQCSQIAIADRAYSIEI